MVDTPKEGLPDWAAALAASRRPKEPEPRGFVVPTKAEASASSPRILRIQPEASGVEKITSNDALHEGAGEWTEFAAWLRRWIGIGDNRKFEPRN